MSELPKGWAESLLEGVISADGVISDGDWVESKDQDPEGSIRLIQLADIGDGEFRNKSNRYMNEEQATRLNCTYLEEGDVLVARMPDPLGRACLFPKIENKSVTVVDVCLIRLKEESALTNKILMHWVNSPYVRNLIDMQATGTTRRRITRKKLSALIFPVPPLNEQIRIANKLDSLLAKVDAAQTHLKKIPSLLKRFRQSVLAAATSGELTREWREGNPLNPPWSELTLGDIADIFTGVTPLKKEMSFYEEGTIPWLTSSVTGQNLVTEAEKFVTEKAVKECRLKLFKPGTLLVAMYGEGKTRGQVTEIAIEATINQACAAVVVNSDKAINKYVRLSIETNYEKTRMMAEGGNQPNLNLSKVRNIPINLPDEAEQKEIIRRVESLFTLADAVEKQYQTAKQRLDRLSQSMLAKAFRGELVPQDPNDEPASELLKRIQAERAQPSQNKPKHKTAVKKKSVTPKKAGANSA